MRNWYSKKLSDVIGIMGERDKNQVSWYQIQDFVYDAIPWEERKLNEWN